MVYKFREGARYPVRPGVAGAELKRLEDINHGELTPALVVDSARSEASPLHDVFTWDDAVAAELHRENQARKLMRDMIIIERAGPDEPAHEIRKYVHVVTIDGPCYQDTRVALGIPERRDQVLADALALLRGVQARYRHLSELNGVFAAIDAAMARLAAHPRKKRARPPANGAR